jgi:MYXO-CTERM domain-containing protein
LAAALLAPSAAAQVGVYGTWVRYGDADYYMPVTKKASFNLRVNEADFGTASDVRDNCILLDTASLFDQTPGAGAQNKDLRLSACNGKAPGTQIADADAAERAATYTPTPVTTQYADLSNNGKYDKGEWVYVTTANAGTSTGGFVASTGTGAWTLRLTSAGTYAAGTFVFAGDTDFASYATAARNQTFGAVEREDKALYLVTQSSATSFLAAKSLVPEKSIRMLAAVQDQPDVKPISLELLTPNVTVGERIKVKVTMENAGKLAGWGLAALKLDGIVLDVRATTVISPSERTTVILSSFVPPVSASAKLEVGDVMQFVDVASAASEPDTTATQVSELVERLATLEAKIAQMEAKEEVKALEATGEPEGKSPGPGFAALVLVGALALIAIRRRRPA